MFQQHDNSLYENHHPHGWKMIFVNDYQFLTSVEAFFLDFLGMKNVQHALLANVYHSSVWYQ